MQLVCGFIVKTKLTSSPNHCIHRLELILNPQLPPQLTDSQTCHTHSTTKSYSVFTLRQHSYSDSDTSQSGSEGPSPASSSIAAAQCFLRQLLLGNFLLLKSFLCRKTLKISSMKVYKYTSTHTYAKLHNLH